MNKNGFTLVELLAVIAIIAILAVLITPGVLSLRRSVLQSSYENKISQIINAAKDYGTENITSLKSPVKDVYYAGNSASEDCIYRTVNFLISNGYLKVANSYAVNDKAGGGEGSTDFIDPRNNKPMNNLSVCIRFDNNDPLKREVIAYIVEE